MKVKEILSVVNTNRRIKIYNSNGAIIYEKAQEIPLGKMPFLDCEVAWIYQISEDEILIRISMS